MKKSAGYWKNLLSGLGSQYAGEFLSMDEKMKTLGAVIEKQDQPSSPSLHLVKKPGAQRIALISDGRGLGAPLNYVIETCLRQNARIELLIHGPVDMINISVLENHIYEAGIDCQRTQFGVNAVEDITDYISNQSALIFVVAMPDDSVAKALIEDVIPKRYNRLLVPMVLIEDSTSALSVKRPTRHLR